MSRNSVLPKNSRNRISPSASSTLSSDKIRMPLLTPDVTDTVAMITESRISAA
ncbi:hypothetical protein D3C80_1852540 [compost metagenome]